MAKKNVFIIGLDEFNYKLLQHTPQAAYCDFHAALDIKDIRNVDDYDMQHLIDKAIKNMENFDGSIDAIASYYDFPGTVMIPILAKQFNLPGPSLEAIMKSENKYWSRLEQQKVILGHIPRFQAFDPFQENVFDTIDILTPYWIKPIKSFRSFLSYQINGEGQFYEAMEEVKKHIDFIGKPFKQLMNTYHMPQEIAEMPESCIAESPIGGAQCTLEGYVYNGRVTVYGVVDSIREPDSSSFARYEYPSSLPLEIQHRMIDVARTAIQQIELDNSPFNIEFFYNQSYDEVFLLEINPRISQAHTDIFEKVHGTSHHQIMLDLALGQKPKVMEKNGKYNLAGHFMVRTFENGVVKKVPSDDEIKALKKEQPDTRVKIPVHPGMPLSDLQGQDSYSYEIANLFIGGRDQADIIEQYDHCLDMLTFEIEPEEMEGFYQ
ncbi:MAG: ATP-grasp domain-containing protein [candidate division KSB1 bacterium]|nr:ATP-grasp domain-containing protein [candidate division KSB1 bacterium]